MQRRRRPPASSSAIRLSASSPAPRAPPVELRRPTLTATLPTISFRAGTLRHPKQRAQFELAAASLHGFRASLDQLGFTEISTPKIVAAATESGANVFSLDYFGKRATSHKARSLQADPGRVFSAFTKPAVFRAEPHDTARNLAEYTSLDAELGFIIDHFDVDAVVRAVIAG